MNPMPSVPPGTADFSLFCKRHEAMARIVWWAGQCLLVLVAAFFLFFGISLFLGSFTLNDPFSFVMTVFGSNLMILISAVLLIGLVLRMVNVYRLLRGGKEPDDSSLSED